MRDKILNRYKFKTLTCHFYYSNNNLYRKNSSFFYFTLMGNFKCSLVESAEAELKCQDNGQSPTQRQSYLDYDQSIVSQQNKQIYSREAPVIFASKCIMSRKELSKNRRVSWNLQTKQNIPFPFTQSYVETNIQPTQIENSTILKRSRIKKPTFAMITIDPKQFIIMKQTSIDEDYEFFQEIGKGAFGLVYKAKQKCEGQLRAVKKISKFKMTNEQRLNFINQFQILKRLDHPHIIKLYDIYDSAKYYYVVTELCEGGNLLQLVNAHALMIETIKSIMSQLLSAVQYMHSFKILHRDLKLQNIVIVRKIDKKQTVTQLSIKIIDFGVSLDLNKMRKRKVDDVLGTIMYMAPECFAGVLNLASDLWSCGIICYLLSTKKYPYQFNNQRQLSQKIVKGCFDHQNLRTLKAELKYFIMLLLEKDPMNRLTAKESLNNVWLKQKRSSLFSLSERHNIATNMLTYDSKNNLVSMIESYLVCKKINQSERQRLAVIFQQIDTDKSGRIQVQQFKSFYASNSQQYDQNQIEELLKIIDKNKSGKIDFNQFISAMYCRRKLFHQKHLEEAFDFFDKDHSGELSPKEVRSILEGIQSEEIQFLFQHLDSNKDSKISKKQFIAYFIKHDQQNFDIDQQTMIEITHSIFK